MADLPRVSSFLPTIKCSMCAADIEISRMGDHICTGSEPTPPSDSYGYFDHVPLQKVPSNDPGLLKPGRAMPPRVDTSTANRPFFPKGQLTPVSSSPSRTMSPFTANDGSRSPFGNGRPLRSATLPIPRGPPSPELLSSNLDCAFPPFPTTKPGKKKTQLAGGYGGMGGETYAEPDPMYAPVSPMSATSGGLLQRMNSIAPGPFDVNGRRNVGNPLGEKGHQRQKTIGGTKDMTDAAETGAGIQRPATAGAGHSRTSMDSLNGSKSGFGLPKQPRKDGYGGFGSPQAAADEDAERASLRPDQRSQTFPLRNPGQDTTNRRPSEPDRRMRRPSNESGRSLGNDRSISGSPPRQRKQLVSGPDLTRKLPPRGASLIRPKTATKVGDAPPIPSIPRNINLAAEFGIGNPYHTPSESQSSDASGYSQGSKASSRSSPPSATADRQRRPSDNNQLDVLMSEVQASMMDLQPKELPSKPSPPKKEQTARGILPPKILDPSLLSPESPMDPAIQDGRLSPVPARNLPRTGSPVSPVKEKPIRRPTTSKGNCKGCGETIKGKSVSSADGRLTGRYHKQCFVCKTCSEPFQTATFYVHNDAPYCERHYHKLNGSVCKTCDKGIEGQYLESQSKQKFHPRCLTCSDCNRTLRNDYFEVNNQVYCERDAFRRVQQQKRFLGPGGGGASTRMERRTTRLMMM